MITSTGAVKVTDFSIARAVADASATVTATAEVIGTTQYLPPEQARGLSLEARSDTYPTGAVLFELLTGMPAVIRRTPETTRYGILQGIPPPPSSASPAGPPDVGFQNSTKCLWPAPMAPPHRG
jgi:eukaryotic-like serine/threonine-protein kinase